MLTNAIFEGGRSCLPMPYLRTVRNFYKTSRNCLEYVCNSNRVTYFRVINIEKSLKKRSYFELIKNAEGLTNKIGIRRKTWPFFWTLAI